MLIIKLAAKDGLPQLSPRRLSLLLEGAKLNKRGRDVLLLFRLLCHFILRLVIRSESTGAIPFRIHALRTPYKHDDAPKYFTATWSNLHPLPGDLGARRLESSFG